jgi:NAD(P)H-hydrate epimerase
MLEPLYTVDEMKAAEAGHDVKELMARAGRAVAEEAMRRFPEARRFVAVCGKGANGGDGRIALEVLEAAGRAARPVEDAPLDDADVIIDALVGTGFHGEPREDAARTIEAINAAAAPVVSVDLPSGVDSSTGEVAGTCVEAAVTVTFHGPKVGLAIAPGRFRAGDVVVADIGLEPRDTVHKLVTPSILGEVPRRRAEQNKYTAGTVLVVGGSRGLTGAPSLTAEAAFRADAGYVAVAMPDSTLPVFEQRLLEAVKLPCPEKDGRISPQAVEPIVEFVNGFRAAPKHVADRVFVSCGQYESLIHENRALIPALQAAGMQVRYVESRDGHNWENWRDRLRDGLTWLYPGPMWMVYE